MCHSEPVTSLPIAYACVSWLGRGRGRGGGGLVSGDMWGSATASAGLR